MMIQDMDWKSVFNFPSEAAIRDYNRNNRIRSPYLCGWFSVPSGTRYTEYAVDFKADHVPRGTYCSLANWQMDHSSLKNRYASVRTNSQYVHAYAGFQKLDTGETVSIMSFWDVFCKDFSGREIKIRAKRVHPEKTSYSEEFWGEGTGAHCTVSYPWKEKHWYRMYLKCRTSKSTGNTVVEQWVGDLESGDYTLLCAYDTGVAEACFQGSVAVFLENYLTEYAGNVRSMEVRNAMCLNADTGRWQALEQVHVSSNGGLPSYEGSYNFGVFRDRLWMITSGVGGDWFNNGKGRRGVNLTLGNLKQI